MQGKNFLEEFHLHWIINFITWFLLILIQKKVLKEALCWRVFTLIRLSWEPLLENCLVMMRKSTFFSQRKIGYYCWRWPRKNTNKFFLHSSPRLTRVILLLWSAYFFKKRCRSRFLLLDSRRILKRCCRLFHTWIEKHPQQQNYPAMTWRKKVPIEIKATQKITIRRPFSILLSRG